MVFLLILLVLVLGFLAVSVFSKDLRNVMLEKIRELFNKGFDQAPVQVDTLVIDPLKEQIKKFRSGATEGGINLGV